MTNPFKIKKEERGLLAVSLIIFVLLNAMTLQNGTTRNTTRRILVHLHPPFQHVGV